MNYREKKKLNTIAYHLLVGFFGFAMIYPLVWMFFSSFKNTSEIFQQAERLFPKTFQFDNYINGWKGFANISFGVFFKNSFFVSVLNTAFTVLSSACIAFGFARLQFPLKKFWFSAMMLTMMLPFQVVMVPQYLIFHTLKWTDTILPLTLPALFGQAFFIFLMIQFIQGLPRELDEAATIDGCSVYKIFLRIILPLIVPALITSAIFAFMWSWDNFMGSLLYLNSPQKYTVAIALKLFCDPTSGSDWGAMFAMACLSLVPIFTIFLTCQKYLVEGISTTGLKG